MAITSIRKSMIFRICTLIFNPNDINYMFSRLFDRTVELMNFKYKLKQLESVKCSYFFYMVTIHWLNIFNNASIYLIFTNT